MPAQTRLPGEWIDRRLAISVLAITGLATICGLGVGYHPLVRRADLLDVIGESNPVTNVLESVSSVGSFLAFLLAAVNVQRRGVTIGSLLLAGIALPPFLLANSPITQPRFIIGAIILTTVFVLAMPGRRGKTILVLSMIAAQFTIFPLLSEISRGRGGGVFSPFRYLAENGDFDGFQSTANVLAWVHDTGLKFGLQLVSAALFWMPRAIFPAKSAGTGLDAAKHMGYDYTNISAPMPAELVADGGVVSLFAFSWALGFGLARLDGAFNRAAASGDWIKLLPPAVAAGYIFIIMRGSLVSVLGPFAVGLALSSIAAAFITHRTRWL